MPIKGNEYREPQYMQTIGYLRIDFKESVLADIMALSENSSANIYMLDADGEIIMSNNAENGAIMPEVESKEIVCEYIVNDEWKICGVVQTDMLFTNRRMILLYLFLILLTVTMLIMIFSNQISRIIITPMKILNDNIRDNMQNRAESRLSLKTGDEIEELCKSFNKMNDEIDRLVNEVYEAEIARKELEVKHKEAHLNALQAQINPHFLYNTFETTNWLILQNQNEEAVNMINRLSDIFRLGINRGRNTFTLREELKQATSYIDIQKMRYAHKLSVVWEYDDSLLECRVVKTILQPILENAIYHGIEPKEEGGEIEISIDRNGDALEICVIDTGVGIEEEKCRDINSDLKNNENKVLRSIGLKNVNDRIKLMYGDDYGISVESIYGKYTEVLITMPFIAKEGDEIDNV
jgi:two-component system sensor histidine kinase YesM